MRERRAPKKRASIGYAFDFCVDNNKRSHKVTMTYLAVSNTSSDASLVDAYGSAGFWKGVVTIESITFGPSGVENITISGSKEFVREKNTHAQL